MKKILAIALVVCMMMTFASFPASAAIASPATLTVVSSSASYSGWTAEKTLDGDNTIGYATSGYHGSGVATNKHEIVYDLGSVTTLDSLTLYWGARGQQWGMMVPDSYKVYVSKDKSTYSELLSYTGLYSNLETYGGKVEYNSVTTNRDYVSAVVTELNLSVEEVRYIKVEIISFKLRACLAEIEATVFEEQVDDGPVGEPVPATLTFSGGNLTTPHSSTKFPTSAAVDGNPDTAYVNGQYKGSYGTGSVDIIYKFDEVHTLMGLTIDWGATSAIGDNWGCQAPDAYNIYVSSDGTSYRKILSYADLYNGAEYDGKVVHHNTSNAYRRFTVTETDLGVKDVMYIKIEVTAWRYRYTITEITAMVRDKSLSLVPTTYTVKYVDEQGKEIADPVTSDANVGDIVVEKPINIEGYKPNDVSKRLTLVDDADSNVITFVYRKVVITDYNVNYVDETGKAVAPQKVVTGVEVGTAASESAIMVDGYLRDNQSAKEFIVAEENEDITFTYTKIITPANVTVPTNTADSAYIIDGKNFDLPTDTTKQWKSDTISSTGDGTTPLMTFIVDLGDAYDVTKYATTQANRYMKYAKFYASNDKQNWTEAVEVDPAWRQETTNKTWYTEGALDFGGAYRYIKLEVMTVAAATDAYMNVYELAFVGNKGIAGVRENLVIKGGQIRLPDDKVSAGLRFGATLQKSFLNIEGDYTYNAKADTTFGMFVLPKDMLATGQTLAQYLVNNNYGGNAVKVPAVKVYSQDDETVTFTAVLTDIPQKDYGRDIVAVAYVCVDGTYAFANEVTKNYMGVAEAVAESYKAGRVELTTSQIAALEEIVGSLA